MYRCKPIRVIRDFTIRVLKFKRPVYRILFYAAWVLLLGGLVTLFVSANRRNSHQVCKGVKVSINNGGKAAVVDAVALKAAIEKAAGGGVAGKRFGDLNLTQLEKALLGNPWLTDAELFFDTKNLLHVSVRERQPVARIFTTAGASFYMDSAGYRMPLVPGFSGRFPVVTGFTAAKKFSVRDSAVITGIKNIVGYLASQPFWAAQVGQIDVTAGGEFDLVPTVGNALIKLGSGEDVDGKLAKLLLFYKQVLPKAGLAKYSAFDVRFNGQVVAVKRWPQSPVDSLQLQKNIQELMRRKATEQEAVASWREDSLPIAVAPVVTVNRDSLNAVKKEAAAAQKQKAQFSPGKNPTPKSNPSKPGSKTPATAKPKQKPKALMHRSPQT